jgi:hypothetical protein
MTSMWTAASTIRGSEGTRQLDDYWDLAQDLQREARRSELNLSALKGEDSQATLRITTLTLAPEGSHRPHASGF